MPDSLPAGSVPDTDKLETLRSILLLQDRDRLEAFQHELEALRSQTEDAEHMVSVIQPLLTEALAARARTNPEEFAEAIRPSVALSLRRQVEEDRESLIAVFTPIIGRTIQRAIAEAMEALARQVDARMQRGL